MKMPSVALKTKEVSSSTLSLGADTEQKNEGPFVFFSHFMLSEKETTYIVMHECLRRSRFLH